MSDRDARPPHLDELDKLLERARTGSDDERAAFFDAVYAELRRIAKLLMSAERKDHTLQATALVHEAFLRLTGATDLTDAARFFGAAAETMRRVLVDHARGRGRQKRGGGRGRVPLDAVDLAHSRDPDEILAIDEALRRLQEHDARAARIAELRLFAGLDDREIARVLDVSDRTIRREWVFTRAWLQRALTPEP